MKTILNSQSNTSKISQQYLNSINYSDSNTAAENDAQFTDEAPFAVHDAAVDDVVSERHVQLERAIEPRLELEDASLVVERKQGYFDGTRSRVAARREPLAVAVVENSHGRSDRLVELRTDVFIVAVYIYQPLSQSIKH